MLEGLDKIDWSQLHHAYGEASDVPELIRKLLSLDKDEREKAVHELFGNIWHQGTIYEVSSYAVPFLYELLKSSETPDKLIVAFLLANLATGTFYFHHNLSNEKDKLIWQEILKKQGTTLEEEISKGQLYESNVRKAIEKEFSLLYSYLFCEVPEVRDSVSKALGEYTKCKSATLPLLEKALASESDEFTKETIENSIKNLSRVI
jgi:hypothetical protein